MNRKDALMVRRAEQLLGTIKAMNDSLQDQPDPAERRHTVRLLKTALKKITAYRKGLEALRGLPHVGPEFERQIQLFLLIEDECRVDRRRSRPL